MIELLEQIELLRTLTPLQRVWWAYAEMGYTAPIGVWK